MNFAGPTSVAADTRGYVYVSDADHTIKKLSSDGQLLATWRANARLHLASPSPVSVNAHDGVYVFDNGAQRSVVKLSPPGRILSPWSNHLLASAYPSGFAVGGRGNVFLLAGTTTRRGNPSFRVLKFSSQGKLLASWASDNAGYDKADMSGIAVDDAGNLYTSFNAGRCLRDCEGGDAWVIEKLNPSGLKIATWSFLWQKPGGIGTAGPGLALDRKRNVHVAGFTSMAKIGAKGSRLWYRYGQGQCGLGKFRGLESAAVDGQANVYVADLQNRNIQKFSSLGKPLAIWGVCPSTVHPPPKK